MTKKLHVAVVGGGISGMTAALVLAQFGHEVTLIERSAKLGQTVRGFTRQGVYFDTGFHYTGALGEHGLLTRYLRFLGLDDLPIVPLNEKKFDTIRFAAEKREICLCTGYEALKERFHNLFPQERQAIDAYFDEARKVVLASPFLNMATDIKTLLSAEAGQDSLAVFLAKRTKDPILNATLSIHTLLHGTKPDEVSFLQHIRVASSYFDSVHTLAGGGQTLVQHFENRLKEEGVRILCGNGVSGINMTDPKTICGVTLNDGNTLDVDTVVYTGHPSFLNAIAPPGAFRPAYRHRLLALEDTLSAYMLFGISDKPIASLADGNLFLCPNADLDAFFEPDRNIETGPFYVTAGRGKIGSSKEFGVTIVGPANMAELTEWQDTVTGKRGTQYTDFKAEKMRRFRNAVVSICPDLADVRFVDGATPLTLRDYTHSPTGSLYGCKHSLYQFNPQPVTRIPNLYLAGQSIIAPGILGAVISAFLVCGFIVGQDTLRTELISCV
ncbi:hypothetical protein FACS1894168_1130 [Deltaproteobacteria bacterium]|nr:hypothetical protein FACS1894168_1130 [Deltaproteobacteria bacterium]